MPTAPSLAWGDFLDAWRQQFPGRFDRFDDYELADAIEAEVPGLRDRLDPLSKEALLAPGRGRPAPILRPQDQPGARFARTPEAPAGSEPQVAEALQGITRAPTLADTATEIGLVAVPSLVGAAGGPAGLLAGGAAGELLRELYQQWSGTRTDGLSPANIAVQAGINLIPGGRLAAGAIAKAAPKLAAATPALTGRLLQSGAEGAIAGTTSTAAERVIRDRELPGVGELALSAALGAGFGGAVGTGAEVVRARRVGAVQAAQDLPALLEGYLRAPTEGKSTAAQAIWDAAEQLRAAGGAEEAQALLAQMVGATREVAQQQLAELAGVFLRDYGQSVAGMIPAHREELAQAFLAGLRERGAGDTLLAQVQQTLAQLHEATPGPLYGPVEGPPTLAAQPLPGPENFGFTQLDELEPLARQMEAGLVQAPTAPPLPRLLTREGVPVEDARVQAALEPYQWVNYARQAGLPLPEAPPRTPVRTASTPPALEAVGVDTWPIVQQARLGREDALFYDWIRQDLQEIPFQRGTAYARGFAPGEEGMTFEGAQAIEAEAGGANVTFIPHAPGSPMSRLFQLLGVKASRPEILKQLTNFQEGRARNPGRAARAATVLARAMREAYQPTAGAFDWSRVTPETLTALSDLAGHPVRRGDLRGGAPLTGLNAYGQPTDLLARYGVRPQPEGPGLERGLGPPPEPPPPFQLGGLEALDPDQLYEARSLVRGLDDATLLRVFDDLEAERAGNVGEMLDAETADVAGAFGGPWYDVGPGLLGEEIERRGLRRYRQPALMSEGPGTPGRLPLLEEGPPEGPTARVVNASGESAASAEALSRQAGMAARGERFAVRRGGQVVPLHGPDAVDYRVGRGEEYGVLEADGRFRVLERGPGAPAGPPAEPPLGAPTGPVDVLPTGEAQPRLPGEVGAIRDEPDRFLLDARELEGLEPDFQLSAPEAPASLRPRAPSLFDDEAGAVGPAAPTAAQLRAAGAKAPLDLRVEADHLAELDRLVADAGDQEVAGLLLGDADGTIRQVVRAPNVAADPARQFAISPQVVAAAARQASRRGWQVLGSFHSQPTGTAQPSRLDLQGTVADYPLLILGATQGRVVEARVWRPTIGPRGGLAAPWLEGSLRVTTPSRADLPPLSVAGARELVGSVPRFTGAPGDRPALESWLAKARGEHWSMPWFVRAQQALEDGNPRLAWLEVQAGTLAHARAGRAAADSPTFSQDVQQALHGEIDRALAAGPQDPVGALFALYDGRTQWVEGVGRVVVAPDLPAGYKGMGVRVGPGGILHPGDPDVRVPTEHDVIAMSVETLNEALDTVGGRTILDDPTKASATRLNRQVAEKLLLTPAATRAAKAREAQLIAGGMSAREAKRRVARDQAAQLRYTATQSAKFLAALSVWKRQHGADIRRIEGITGASGELRDVQLFAAGGRRLGALGDLAEASTVKDLLQPGRAWDQIMLMQDLTREPQAGFSALGYATRGFMLSQPVTALRNFYVATARWGLEALRDAGEGVAQSLRGRPGKAIAKFRKVADMARLTPILRPDGWVMPWHARQAEWEQVLGGLLHGGGDRAAALRLVEAVGGAPEMMHFLGAAAFGEPTPVVQSQYRFLNWLGSTRVQHFLTMFNRAQEFTVRSAFYTAELKYLLRRRGLDPDALLSLPPADVVAAVGGPESLQRLLHQAVAGALDFTFAGHQVTKGLGKDVRGAGKRSVPAELISLVNRFPIVREGYPFPRFNFSAAPRFIWDHGPWAMLEAVNAGLNQLGGYGLKRGRLYLGQKAARYEGELLPEIARKLYNAEADYGEALQAVRGVQREATVMRRLVARADRRGLPAQATAGRERLAALDQALEAKAAEAETLHQRLKDLEAQQTTLREVVTTAQEVRAPEDVTELASRALFGTVGLLMPAVLLRADQMDKGTKWYQLKYDLPGLGETVIDTRPMAPLTQYLFVGDLINDLVANTDWLGVTADVVDQGMTPEDAFWGRYEGKYTNASLVAETMHAFLSISQMAGTTLALVDHFANASERGLSPQAIFDTFMRTVGGFLARFTVPAAPFKALASLADPTEAQARIAQTSQGWAAPLAQPLGNLPFIGAAVIPETYNQLTGQPLETFMPLARAAGGVSLQTWHRITGEVAANGVPGQSVYIRSSGDYALDRLIATHYAYGAATFWDQLVTHNAYYQSLDSPATRRDYLQRYVFPPLKKYALGQTMMDAGVMEVRQAFETPEGRRRRMRAARVQQVLQQEGIRFDEPGEAGEPSEFLEPEPLEPPEAQEPPEAAPPEAAPPSLGAVERRFFQPAPEFPAP